MTPVAEFHPRFVNEASPEVPTRVAAPVAWLITYRPLLCDETPYSVPVVGTYSSPCITIAASPYGPTRVAVPVGRSSVKSESRLVDETYTVLPGPTVRAPVVPAFALTVPNSVLAPVVMSISYSERLLSTAMTWGSPAQAGATGARKANTARANRAIAGSSQTLIAPICSPAVKVRHYHGRPFREHRPHRFSYPLAGVRPS
jgi:hypothetical protein